MNKKYDDSTSSKWYEIYEEKLKATIVIIFFILITSTAICLSQTDEPRVKKVDSVFIYKPSNPLQPYNPNVQHLTNALGLDVIFSNSGLGLGFFWDHFLSRDDILFTNLYISGARNTDEIEYWNGLLQTWEVPNKINRLFLIPLTIGYSKLLFQDELSGSFKPYLSLGAGPSIIISTPYKQSPTSTEIVGWFESFNYAKAYVRPSAYLGIGTFFSVVNNSVACVNIKYYYIPFGGNGIESIRNLPIKDFGGLVLTFSVGYSF